MDKNKLPAVSAITTEQLYKKSEDFLKQLLKQKLGPDSQIFLFGSRAAGDFSRSSDVDIGVISPNLDRKTIIHLKEIIAESFVPYKVDIVDFAKVDETFKKEALRSIVRW